MPHLRCSVCNPLGQGEKQREGRWITWLTDVDEDYLVFLRDSTIYAFNGLEPNFHTFGGSSFLQLSWWKEGLEAKTSCLYIYIDSKLGITISAVSEIGRSYDISCQFGVKFYRVAEFFCTLIRCLFLILGHILHQMRQYKRISCGNNVLASHCTFEYFVKRSALVFWQAECVAWSVFR